MGKGAFSGGGVDGLGGDLFALMGMKRFNVLDNPESSSVADEAVQSSGLPPVPAPAAPGPTSLKLSVVAPARVEVQIQWAR